MPIRAPASQYGTDCGDESQHVLPLCTRFLEIFSCHKIGDDKHGNGNYLGISEPSSHSALIWLASAIQP